MTKKYKTEADKIIDRLRTTPQERVLREIKKLEEKIKNMIADEMRKEIDAEILKELNNLYNVRRTNRT